MDDWELVARERIRDSIARYTWAGDSVRADDLAAVFHPEGELVVPGRDPLVGRAAIAAFILGIGTATVASRDVPRMVRHSVTNTIFVEVTPKLARVDSYFTVVSHAGLDHTGRYRDVFEPVGDEWLIRLRKAKTDWWAPESVVRFGRPE